MTIYTINCSFSSSVERTSRVLEIAEGFGLGLTEKRFTIYDNLQLDLRADDVVYINGQSGSGKSLLLRELVRQMRAEGRVVADLNEIELDDRPVIDQLGKNTNEALYLLARAGISDAWIYIRKPSELSDGQRYRLKLAKVMETDADVWAADEFGAVLDRVTAKAIAMSVQKVARERGKSLIVATTHTDLEAELAPNIAIYKRFKEKVDITQGEAA
ncbi:MULTISPECIES: ATP-binding cassette domain-containing protein [unclassified Ensifer]|uniref:ATP-binding cassette domain-containing protein n=1 Tax=unclassified Ensifer TaxID=2633371 RepID=UPI0008139593|nr:MULTISPECIES: ATP-binding cassette domain-containing protein [unclassified Ensifer]OCP21916.1 ABC transporter [Ensifer sp. LC54]OCP23304.1 ABC transporter [Ensifer sp. LC384]